MSSNHHDDGNHPSPPTIKNVSDNTIEDGSTIVAIDKTNNLHILQQNNNNSIIDSVARKLDFVSGDINESGSSDIDKNINQLSVNNNGTSKEQKH
eukprot:8834120-Ditylum_brightwellii.AAC.1